MDDAERFIEMILKASDPANKYEYEQTQTATWGNLMGEEKLLMALLEDAFLSIRGRRTAGVTTKQQKPAREEAMEWVERMEDSPFGFVFTCHILELNAQAVRKAARAAYASEEKTGRHLNRVVR
ncbi:MAG: hypothetical protein U1E51_19925 [Candidatus Binatia bacterium]|nr:hypothetical protein [Candidatus Binatia bacterium]